MNEINIKNIKNKNLFDIAEIQIQKLIFNESKRDYIQQIQLNEYTINRLKNKGIYGFININSNENIPIVKNNDLSNFEIFLVR